MQDASSIRKRRSKFAAAAETWMREHASARSVTSAELWKGLESVPPDLTTASLSRKTPKATCMRDLRFDGAFVVAAGKITLKGKAGD